ncbi:MAG: hypothetical protein VKO39_12225 [Cyanobacteriota bacterium]|nr:hypothetical protein [Cyanobacteriota bacterium]
MNRPIALSTESGCALAIGPFPRFRYDASGGGGLSRPAEPRAEEWQTLWFDAASLRIPPLSSRTTRLLGLPLPPGLRIAIAPERLEGRWHPTNGAVELTFAARFHLLVAERIVAPALVVSTQLATGTSRGRRHQECGRPLDGQGRGVLVGIATVPPTGEGWLDRFLGLPDEALAVLQCRFLAAEHP